jgi:hypothetical protein
MNYRNAKYINDRGWIDCEIEHPTYGWIPYTLDPADTDTTVNNDDLLSAMSLAGDVAAYLPPTQAELDDIAAQGVRYQREIKLITEVDPVAGNALRWASLSAEQQAAWAKYRQDLLDITTQSGFPSSVIWPIQPTA